MNHIFAKTPQNEKLLSKYHVWKQIFSEKLNFFNIRYCKFHDEFSDINIERSDITEVLFKVSILQWCIWEDTLDLFAFFCMTSRTSLSPTCTAHSYPFPAKYTPEMVKFVLKVQPIHKYSIIEGYNPEFPILLRTLLYVIVVNFDYFIRLVLRYRRSSHRQQRLTIAGKY